MQWLWAAYRKGGLPKAYFKDDLSQEEFAGVVAFLLENYDAMFVIETEKPIGVAVGRFEDAPHYERPHIIPHVSWFPWAGKKDRVHGMANFVDGLRDDFLVLAAVRIEDKRLFELLSDAGLGKRVGSIDGFFKKGDKTALFQAWSKD